HVFRCGFDGEIVAAAVGKEIGGQTEILGGAGNDTLNLSDQGKLESMTSRLIFRGDAHIEQESQQVNYYTDFDDQQKQILDNAPLVFVDTAPNRFFTDIGGNTIEYAMPVTAPIVIKDGSGDILVESVVLYTQNIQLWAVQEYGEQKRDIYGHVLWYDINGSESTDPSDTGIPVISRSTAGYGRLVYFNEKGDKVFKNTGIPSIVDPLPGETPRPVYMDADGNKTFTNTGRPWYAFRKGDIVQDMMQEKGVQEYGIQKTDGSGNKLYYTDVGEETTTVTAIPIILTKDPTEPGARPVFLDESWNKTFTNTGIVSYITDFENGELLYVNNEGNKVTDGRLVVDLYGPDFTIYELDAGAVEFHRIRVEASIDGANWVTVNNIWPWVVHVQGDENHGNNSFARSYDLAGTGLAYANYIRIVGTSSAVGGFDLDAVGIIHGGANAPPFPTLLWNTSGSGLQTIMGFPDDQGFNLSDNRSITYIAAFPSLIPVNRVELEPYTRATNVHQSFGGADSLLIDNSADGSNITGTLDTYELPIDKIDGSGVTAFHDGADSADEEFFFGGEPVLDPFTKEPLFYEGGEPVRDLFTREVLLDLAGSPIPHAPGDPILHYANDRVYYFTGDIQRYLGGEQVYDEDGNAVKNWDDSFFLHQAGQALIHNRRDSVYDLLDETGQRVEIGTAFTPPTFVFNSGFGIGDTLDLSILGYNLNDADSIVITILRDSEVSQLAGNEFDVDPSDPQKIVLNTAIAGKVSVKVVIAVQAVHESGEPIYYFGDEALQVGQAQVDTQGNLVLDESGAVALHTAETIVDAKGEQKFHKRGEPVYVLNNGEWVIDTYDGGEAKLYLGNEAWIYYGGEPAFYNEAELLRENWNFQRISLDATGADTLEDIFFDGLEETTDQVTIKLGSGHDLLAVKSTQASTILETGGGNDTINVRSDIFSLDDIHGALHVDVQGGTYNVLQVSDAKDPDADADVVITASSITGLAPAPITYLASGGRYRSIYDAGAQSFSNGIAIFGGTGGNNISITDTRNNAPVIEVTTLYSGLANDTITVSDTNPRYLVVYGQTGNDTLDASTTSGNVTLFGDSGDDNIQGGTGDDVLGGDLADNSITIFEGAPGSDTIIGRAGNDVIVGDNTRITRAGDYTVLRIETDNDDSGGNDTIDGASGDDIIIGGAADDQISAAVGNNIILGDSGVVVRNDGSADANDIFSTSPEIGGKDSITGGADGANILMGGADDDVITGGIGDDVILGDSGRVIRDSSDRVKQVVTISAVGGSDTIAGGSGDNIIMGGPDGDDISAPLGNNIILGDNGEANLNSPSNDVFTIDPLVGGPDTIIGGADGANILVGGADADFITGGIGNDVILGDGGWIFRDSQNTVIRVETVGAGEEGGTIGGNDTIQGDKGLDIILGGAEDDTIQGGAGDDFLLGDNGIVVFNDPSDSELSYDIFSTDPVSGGDDTIIGSTGNDFIIGGSANDILAGGIGSDVLLGDDGYVKRNLNKVITQIFSLYPETGGDDEIDVSEYQGADIIMGGSGNDQINAGPGENTPNILLGDNGVILFESGVVTFDFGSADSYDIFSTRPE
ncbi:beta strand repeat-containing protein, partial [Thermodesulfobacteriota bacterium]